MKTPLLFAAAVLIMSTAPSSYAQASNQTAVELVRQVVRADYEGDRPALASLHSSLGAFSGEPALRSRIHYWRGYAMWRRALNGFNEAAPAAELERDLQQCIADFREASAADPTFADAHAGEASCLVNLSFLKMSDAARAREWFVQAETVLETARRLEPDNPRVLWVLGANQWYAPAARGGGQGIAIATYERGLRLARQRNNQNTGPLEPQWGEAELLMNLAFAHFHTAPPEINRADAYAREALALVPYWHYLRDILLADITKAKKP